LDIYPTLIELCGLPKNDALDGLSLVPQLINPPTKRDRPAITTNGPDNHSVRTERFRYTLYGDGSEEFYDMLNDPHEWTNSIADPKHQEEIRKLEQWIPQNVTRPVSGSHTRLIEKRDGVWYWENEPIPPNAPVPALGIVPQSNAPKRQK